MNPGSTRASGVGQFLLLCSGIRRGPFHRILDERAWVTLEFDDVM